MEIDLSRLQQEVEETLKFWGEGDTDSGRLGWLSIFQKARLKASTTSNPAHHLINTALNVLESDHNGDAHLIRRYFFEGDKMRRIANQRNISESTAYRRKDDLIHQLALILQNKELQAREHWQKSLDSRSELPLVVPLVGVEDKLNRLSEKIMASTAPWGICVSGLGGLGKTALANLLIRQTWIPGYFQDVVWVSAKPENKFADYIRPALQTSTLIDILLGQLRPNVSPSLPASQKQAALMETLKEKPYLIVVDNLETVADYETLLPTLLKLANPSKFLLTSRHALHHQPQIFNLDLDELDETDTLRFLKQELELRGLTTTIPPSNSQLQTIYEIVGGNPLALKLVIGQLSFLSLPQVLTNLKQAKTKTVEAMYNYIYWQAWQMLDEVSQRVFLVMPLMSSGTIEQLSQLTQLDIDVLSHALQQLTALSLIQVGGNLEARRYMIHRLTETFLLHEAIQWQQAA